MNESNRHLPPIQKEQKHVKISRLFFYHLKSIGSHQYRECCIFPGVIRKNANTDPDNKNNFGSFRQQL